MNLKLDEKEMRCLLSVLAENSNKLHTKYKKYEKKAESKQNQTEKLMLDTARCCYQLSAISKLMLGILTVFNDDNSYDEDIARANRNLELAQLIIRTYENSLAETVSEIGELN